MLDTAASFLDQHRLILDDENDGAKFHIAIFRLTPTSLSMRWRVSKGPWCDIARSSKQETPTPAMSTQHILKSLYRLTHKLNQDLHVSLERNTVMSRHAFLLSEGQIPGDWGHGILRALLFDSIAWATMPFTPTTFTAGYPHQAETDKPSDRLTSAHPPQRVRVLDAYKKWPTTVTTFIRAWKEETLTASVPTPSDNLKDLVTALYNGTSEKGISVVEKVKANFCSASLGLMILVLGKEADGDHMSFDVFLKKTEVGMKKAKWARHLCAIYTSAALSPICLLANFKQSQSGSTNVSLHDLVGMLSTSRVQDNATMLRIEYDCFSIILAMCIRGPSAFAEEMKVVADGWESAKQEAVPSVASDWDTIYDQIKKQRPISWQICEHLREAARSNETLRIDDTWFAHIASCLAEDSSSGSGPDTGPDTGPDMPPKANTSELNPQLFRANAGPHCPVNGWLSLMQSDIVNLNLPSQVGLDTLFSTSLPGTGISERSFPTCIPRTSDAEHAHTPFDDWTMESINDDTTPPPVNDWFSNYIPETSHTVPAVTNPAYPDDVYTRPHTTYSRGSIPDYHPVGANTKRSDFSSDHTVLKDPISKVCKWPGMAHELGLLDAILENSRDKRFIHTTTHHKWEASSAEKKRDCFTTWPILVTESPNTGGRNLCVTDQVDTLVQRPALGATLNTFSAVDNNLRLPLLDMSIASTFHDQELARSCRLSLEEFLRSDEHDEKASVFYIQEEWIQTGHHVGKYIEELDDISRYTGHHDPTFAWKTEVHGKDTGASWFTAASKDVVSRPRMAASGLATVLKQTMGRTMVYIADKAPPIHADNDLDCRATTWSATLIVPGDILIMRPGTVYATVTIETGLLMGTHFYCTATLGRTLRALVRSAPISTSNIYIVGNKSYNKAIITLFKLLHAWVTAAENANTRQSVPVPTVVCPLLLLVENADYLVQPVLSSTPEFTTDFAHARRLIRRYWDVSLGRCEPLYTVLQEHEVILQMLVSKACNASTKLRSLTGSAPGTLKSIE